MAPQEDEELRMPKSSATGTRTRVARVRAEYPNQLDYSGRYIDTNLVGCGLPMFLRILAHRVKGERDHCRWELACK